MTKQIAYLLLCLLLSLTACTGKNQPSPTATPEGIYFAISWLDERKALIPAGISPEVRAVLSAGEVAYVVMSLDTEERPIVVRKTLKVNGIQRSWNVLGPTDLTFFAIIQPPALEYLDQLDGEGSLLFAHPIPPDLKLDSHLVDRMQENPLGTSTVFVKLLTPPDERQKIELEQFLTNTYFPRNKTTPLVDGDIFNFQISKIIELPYVIIVGPSGGELVP